MSSDVINGFICHNCTDIDLAKRNIDPAHPKDGPFGINAASTSSPRDATPGHGPAVTFGGQLAGVDGGQAIDPNRVPGATPGGRLRLSA